MRTAVIGLRALTISSLLVVAACEDNLPLVDMAGRDLTMAPDLTLTGDGGMPDGAAPDLTPRPDQLMPDGLVVDLALVDTMIEPDLAVVPDMVVVPDLVELPDVVVLPDMAGADMTPLPDLVVADLVEVPDLVTPPDLFGVCTTDANCPGLQVCKNMLCAAAAPTDQAGDVIVTEFSALGSEMIEIHNRTNMNIDVHGYRLSNIAGQSAVLRATTDLDGTAGTPITVAAGGYAYGIANPQNGMVPMGVSFVYGAPGTTFALNDMGDVLMVHSAAGRLQDYVDFRMFGTDPNIKLTATQFAGFTGSSTQLDGTLGSPTAVTNDASTSWCVTFYPAMGPRQRVPNTAGSANGSCKVAVINEILIDSFGSDDGNAFIEIAGPGGFDLSGARVEDIEGRGTSAGATNATTNTVVVLPMGTRIPVDGLLVIGDELTTSGTTNVAGSDVIANDADFENGPGDSIQLVTMAGALLDAVGHDGAGGTMLDKLNANNGLAMYETQTSVTPPAGSSLARDIISRDRDDNKPDFHGDPSPTPGKQNDSINFTLATITPNQNLATLTTSITITGTDLHTGMTLTFGANAPANCSITGPTAGSCAAVPANMGGMAARVDVVANPAMTIVANPFTLMGAFTYTGVLNGKGTGEADFCIIQFPKTFNVTAAMETPLIYGRIYENGVTEAAGANNMVKAELGWGPSTANPTTAAGWTWLPAAYNVQVGNDDEYQHKFTAPTMAGVYNYAYRFSMDDGINYTYCDADGAGSNGGLSFNPMGLGVMTVTP